MSKHIISALRCLPQLKGSTFLAAIEIAHRMDDHNGSGFMSYSMIAAKTHQSLRTAFRQVARLEAMGIIAVQRFWQPGKHWGVNKYRFLIRWDKPKPAHAGSPVTMLDMFPKQRNTSKFGSIESLKKGKDKALCWLTPGSQLYTMTEAIAVPS